MRSVLFDHHREVVRPEWIDDNDHMNMGYYVVAFDLATDAWLTYVGLSEAERASRRVTTFSLESHVTYVREVFEGDALRFTTRLLGFDKKRIHYFHEMFHEGEGYLAATNELMSLHVSQDTRRAATMAPELLDRLSAVLQEHASLPTPAQVGRRLGMDQRPLRGRGR